MVRTFQPLKNSTRSTRRFYFRRLFNNSVKGKRGPPLNFRGQLTDQMGSISVSKRTIR